MDIILIFIFKLRLILTCALLLLISSISEDRIRGAKNGATFQQTKPMVPSCGFRGKKTVIKICVEPL